MMWFKRLLLLLALIGASPALAQTGAQFGAGQIWGNSTASQRPGRTENVTDILDRAFGSTRGAILERAASAWALTAPGGAGLPYVSNGAGNDPTYQALAVPAGGTGIVSYTIGDILFASGATTLSKLADIATGNALISGGVGVAPSWGKIGISTHVSGLGTGVAAALAVNTGSGGAFVIFNGALGAPSSAGPISGGAANGSGLTVRTTSSGTPSGDVLSLLGSTVTIGNNINASSIVNFGSTLGGGITVNIGNGSNGVQALNVFTVAGASQTWVSGGGSTTITFPATTGTLVTKDSTDVLTNKTYNSAGTGNVFQIGGVTVTMSSAPTYLVGTSTSALLTPGVVYVSEQTTTFGATTTFDFSLFINTVVTLTGNITTQTLTNVTAGKSGNIRFLQDGTGSRTTVWNSVFKFPSAVTPTLTTTAGASDMLSYHCITTTFCQAALSKDVR